MGSEALEKIIRVLFEKSLVGDLERKTWPSSKKDVFQR